MKSVKVNLLSSSARLPTKASLNSNVYNIASADDYTIIPFGGRKTISTDLGINIPHGIHGRLTTPPDLLVNHGLFVGSSLLLQGYTENMTILVFNFGIQPFVINNGDIIAQLVFEKSSDPILVLSK